MTNLNVIVTGELIDENGNLKQKFVKHNLITNKGYDFLSDCFGNTTRPSPMRFIAIGTGLTAPALTDTQLENEVIRKETDFTHGTGDNFFNIGITLLAGEGMGALTEAGLFNAKVDGDMFDRVIFPVINKGELDIVRFSFNVTFTEVIN